MAQVYATLPTGLGEPPKRLVGWAKVALAAGATQTVSVTIPAQRFATWDVGSHAWKVNSGTYTLLAGTSSRDVNALTASVSSSAH
ncbi:hypothetical protein LMG28614_00479 [Paraburkholderia ultramafica]|uniref:Fibronectin type III-like domain-containing protein n=1 Tax=Paraburkholderia ultramafica TaxID=1544867 RepID=A0A6S7CDH8_9BURK|nr:fibronectin type III-like domain-contianing protein [Paraburkholderia ultramafica]CAB3777859.1 hypothetical protein LMG28614_00479 [Paraburkholderia ultramafica]